MSAPHPFLPVAEIEPLRSEAPITVAFSEPAPMSAGDALIYQLADGTMDVDLDPGEQALPPTGDANEHYANIAEHLNEGQLNAIAQDVIEMVDADIESRQEWYRRLAKGVGMLGVIDETGVQLPYSGASTAVHPLIVEAIVQFQSRAKAELFPPKGPAKAEVLGQKSRELDDRATRVADYLNYQSTIEDKPYYVESDKILWIAPQDGCVFRKVCRDHLAGRNVRVMVRAEDFIVPYSASTLYDTPRYTHRQYYSQQEMKQLQAMGVYRQTTLGIPASNADVDESSELQDVRDRAEGREDPDVRPEDREHCVYEMNVYYAVPGFEDLDEDGKETHIALPWVISVERDDMKVLSIRRGWKKEDAFKLRRIQFVRYCFIEGDGFYGYGLFHLIGGLSRAATGALRVILDNAAWAALNGGFKSKDANLPSNVELAPGKWIDTEMTIEELQRAFFAPPRIAVPDAMFKVLELLTELGRRFASTTEATVGDASNTGPVGTTVALIEQGSKVSTAIHARMHTALGEELRLLADLNYEYIPEEGYPYEVGGGDSRTIFRDDFGPPIDINPVSDPNIFSQTQRIAIAQTELQLSESRPDLYNIREVHRAMLEAIRAPNIDTVLIEPRRVPRADPISENALAMAGEPIRVYLDQNHEAHVAVHMGQLQMLAAQQSLSLQNAQQLLVPHIQEHEAQGMRLRFMQQIGMPLPPFNLDADSEEPPAEMPPELENEVAMRAAQVMQAMLADLQQQQLAQQQALPAPGEAQPDPAQEEARKDEAMMAEQRRKDMALTMDIDRKDAASGIDPATVKAAGKFLAERGMERAISPRKLAVVSQTLGAPFADVLLMLMRMQAGGQGMGPAPLVMNAISPRR